MEKDPQLHSQRQALYQALSASVTLLIAQVISFGHASG